MKILLALTILFSSAAFASTPTKTPLQQLQHSKVFAPGGVGYSGALSKKTLAFREVLKAKNAKAQFAHLYESKNRVAQLYALAGFHFTDAERYKKELARLKNDEALVNTQFGCLGGSKKISELIAGQSGTNFTSSTLPLMLSGDATALRELTRKKN